jgi:DNA topoisomerase-1
MQLLNGRWGPYLAKGKANYKLPKGVEPKDLSFDECLKIIEGQPQATKKAANKKPTTAPVKKVGVKKKETKKTSAAKSTKPAKPKSSNPKTTTKKK